MRGRAQVTMSDTALDTSERIVVDLAGGGLPGRVTLSLKRDATTLAVDTAPSFTFDLRGRLVGGFDAGRTYRHTLDHRVIEKRGQRVDGERVRERRTLSVDEVRTLVATAYGYARQARDALAGDSVRAIDASVPDHIWRPRAAATLTDIAAWDETALEADAQLFQTVYQPIGILPPDQYRALVLQATQGCSYNRCTFCSFYRGQGFRIKTPPEFERHLRAVEAFHGRALPLYRSLFLGEANALIAPQRLLVPMLDLVNREFEVASPDLSPADRVAWLRARSGAFDGIYAFVSALDALRKSRDDIRELRARGLRRVYIGLESGDDAVLRFLNKPNTAAQALDGVRDLKAGGVAVGVVVMLGIGGARYAADHVARTADILNGMALGPDDILYFSEYVGTPGSEYGQRAAEAGIQPLSHSEMQTQRAALEARLTFPGPPPKRAIYDIREFAY